MNKKNIKNNEVVEIVTPPIKTRIRRSYAQIEKELRGEKWEAPVPCKKKKIGSVKLKINDLPPEFRVWGGTNNTGAALVLKLNEVKKVEIIIDEIIIEEKDFNKIIKAYHNYVGFNIETSFKQEVTTENKIAIIKVTNILRVYFPVLMLKEHKIKVRYRSVGNMDRHTIDLTTPTNNKIDVQESKVSKTKRIITKEEKNYMESLMAKTGVSITTARRRAKEKFTGEVISSHEAI